MGFSCYGYVYDADGNAVEGVKVLPYFKKVDSGSDDSKWSDEYYETDSNGYYSYSPEDNALLTSEGSYKKGSDHFYCAYVMGGGETIDSLDLNYAMFHDYEIPSADDIQVDITLLPVRSPVIDSYSFPDAVLTQHEYQMSEESYTDTSWESADKGEDRSQKLTYDLVDIFDGHQLIDTVYSWGEPDDREIANNSSDSYKFIEAGDYTLKIKVREKWNTYTEVTKDVRVKYNEPVLDFDWTPTQTNDWEGAKIKGTEEITFRNKSTCLDDRLSDPYTYKWTIEDKNQDDSDNTQVVDDAKYDDEPKHQFQSAGDKTVTLKCYWNDGFEDKEVEISKTISIYPYRIIPEFTWSATPHNRGQEIEFDPSGTSGDTDRISKYDWVIPDRYPAPDNDNGLYTFADDEDSVFGEGSSDNTQEVDNTYEITDTEKPKIKFHSVVDEDVKVTITYNDGWKDVTDEITKTTSKEKYTVTPAIVISDKAPKGRDKEVTHTNNSSEYTQDDTDIGYTIDWYVDDEYKECNLDNPNPGEITDNSEELLDKDKDTEMKHNYQNTDTHTVKLVVRYDDGWQRQEVSTTDTVTPVVYDGLVADFTWSPEVPKDRNDEVTFENKSTDDDDRFRSYSWVIEDHYNKWNPDSDKYGEEVVDNTLIIEHDTDKDLRPTHKFQDNTDEKVTMTYWYDDGYCEAKVHKEKIISKDTYIIEPEIATDKAMVGKVEVTYTNDSTGSTSKMLDEKWVWNDKTFPDEDDEITIRDDQEVQAEQKFTWQYPSRKPYSAIDGATADNKNKTVQLEVRIDTGWRNDTDDGGIGDDNDSNGGQVYWLKEKQYEASPYEISSTITYETNVDDNKW